MAHRRRHRSGKLDLIIGPMFCGKTTELLRRTERLLFADKRCLLIGYAGDTRYMQGGEAEGLAHAIVSHDGKRLSACPATELPRGLPEDWHEYDAIAIDEVQFIKGLEDFVREAVEVHGIYVIAAGLDTDYERKPFDRTLSLVPLADNVQKYTAICSVCKEDGALFSLRKDPTNFATEVIGGEDQYQAVCRACHTEAMRLRRA